MSMKHKIFIADRGNVQFWYPEDWKVTPQKGGSVKFEDPKEDCVLEVSYFHLPQVDIPLPSPREQLWSLLQKDHPGVKEEEIRIMERSGQRLAGVIYSFDDPNEHREARCYMAVVNNKLFQALITFAYWPEHTSRFRPVLDMVLDSFMLGDGFQYSSPQQALQTLITKN